VVEKIELIIAPASETLRTLFNFLHLLEPYLFISVSQSLAVAVIRLIIMCTFISPLYNFTGGTD